MTRRLLGGGAWALVGRLVTALAGLFISALLARLLTPDAFGAFLLATSMVTVLALAAPLGLNLTVVRIISEALSQQVPGRARQMLTRGVGIALAGWLLIAALLVWGNGKPLAGGSFDLHLLADLLGLVALWVLTRTVLTLTTEIFRGFQDIRAASIFGGALSNSLMLLICIGWWWLDRPLELRDAFVATLIAEAVSVLLSARVLARHLATLEGPGEIRAGELLSISAPLWVTSLTLFVLTQVDLWIVAAFLPPDQVGIYGSAVRLVQMVVIPLTIVNLVLPPIIAEMNATSRLQPLEQTLRVTATLAGIPAFMALGLFLLFGGPILGLAYGDYYRDGAVILMLLSVGQLVNVLAGSCGMVLMMTGHQRQMMLISITCGVGMVSSAWLVAEVHGTVGVAACAMGWLALQNVLMVLAVRATLGIWTVVSLSPHAVQKLILPGQNHS